MICTDEHLSDLCHTKITLWPQLQICKMCMHVSLCHPSDEVVAKPSMQHKGCTASISMIVFARLASYSPASHHWYLTSVARKRGCITLEGLQRLQLPLLVPVCFFGRVLACRHQTLSCKDQAIPDGFMGPTLRKLWHGMDACVCV